MSADPQSALLNEDPSDYGKLNGPIIDRILLTHHAIERCWERCTERFLETRLHGESPFQWLARQVHEAVLREEIDADGNYVYNRMKFSLSYNHGVVILKTVMTDECVFQRESQVKRFKARLLEIAAATDVDLRRRSEARRAKKVRRAGSFRVKGTQR